jgi:uncharacterized coiled-coil DUF342 family protein
MRGKAMENKQIDIEKIKLELSRMDDDYWTKVTKRGTELSEESARITTAIKDAFTKLAVTQMNILEARRSGYKRLIVNKRKSGVADIVSQNKERINQLTNEKRQTVTSLQSIINELTAIIKEVQTLGNGGDKNG